MDLVNTQGFSGVSLTWYIVVGQRILTAAVCDLGVYHQGQLGTAALHHLGSHYKLYLCQTTQKMLHSCILLQYIDVPNLTWQPC